MSGMTWSISPLPPGTTPERELADRLANLLYFIELRDDWRRAVERDGPDKLHNTKDTYGDMLKWAEENYDKVLFEAKDVLYSVGRYRNPPIP